MRRALLVLAFACLLTAAPATRAADDPRLLDGGADRELRHAFLPSPRNVHGELRLLRRGEAWVLQTLLDTRQLRRGVQRMRRKELYAWPEGRAGFADSQRYLADLESAKDHALARVSSEIGGDDRQTLLIELVIGPREALWAFFEVELARAGERRIVQERRPFLVRSATREYLRRAFVVQAETGFESVPPELAELP